MNEDSMRGGFTHDPGEYLNRVGDFLRGMPVEHNVLLSNASRRAGREQINDADLWLWVEAGNQVVAAAQHTPPHGAYLSTGPGEAMRLMAQILWEQRPWLPGVAGTTPSPGDFADEWVRLGGPPAVLESREGTYIASRVDAPADVLGALRIAELRDVDLLRAWAAEFMAETELTTSDEDLIGPRVEAGRMFVWEVDGQAVAMAAVTDAHGGVSRVHLVFTPPQNRKQGFASACVAAITSRELANPGRLHALHGRGKPHFKQDLPGRGVSPGGRYGPAAIPTAQPVSRRPPSSHNEPSTPLREVEPSHQPGELHRPAWRRGHA